MRKCEMFTAEECVSAQCPIALTEEYPWYENDVKTCDECHYNTGKCNDCILNGSDKRLACPEKIVDI